MKRLFAILAACLMVFTFTSMGLAQVLKGKSAPKDMTQSEKLSPAEKMEKNTKTITKAKPQPSTKTTAPAGAAREK